MERGANILEVTLASTVMRVKIMRESGPQM